MAGSGVVMAGSGISMAVVMWSRESVLRACGETGEGRAWSDLGSDCGGAQEPDQGTEQTMCVWCCWKPVIS